MIATTSNASRAARSRAIGADDVIGASRAPDWDDAVQERTGGQGADRIIDVGGPATLSKSLRAVRPGGRIQLVGSLAGPEHVIDASPSAGGGPATDRGYRLTTASRRDQFDMVLPHEDRVSSAHRNGLRGLPDLCRP